jgi:hypothetical protein
MRAEHSVVEDEIDARARRQGREEFQRLEEEMTRAVGPGGLEREQDAAVVQEPETLLRDRRAQQIATELLEARAVPGGHGEIGVKVEAIQVCVPPSAGDHPGGVRLLTHAPHATARAAPQRDASPDQSTADPGEDRRFFGHGIRYLEGGLPAHIHGNIERLVQNLWPGGATLVADTTDGDVFLTEDEGETWSTIASRIGAVSKGGHYLALPLEGILVEAAAH